MTKKLLRHVYVHALSPFFLLDIEILKNIVFKFLLLEFV